jgi:hypothetical protein
MLVLPRQRAAINKEAGVNAMGMLELIALPQRMRSIMAAGAFFQLPKVPLLRCEKNLKE